MLLYIELDQSQYASWTKQKTKQLISIIIAKFAVRRGHGHKQTDEQTNR